MMYVYVPRITNRIRYAFDLILGSLFTLEYKLTSDKSVFEAHNGPKFIYGKEKDATTLFFCAHDLLFENTIRTQSFEFGKWNNVAYFFKVGNRGILPFDPFAAAFYLVTRYEEYLPSKKDRLDRFRVEESLAYNHRFLETPIVNAWATQIRDILLSRFPELIIPRMGYRFHSSVNIYTPYAYKYRSWREDLKTLVRELKTFELSRFTDKLRVIKGTAQDPYDTFDKLHQLHKRYNLQPLYFFQLPDGLTNPSVSVGKYEEAIGILIRKVSENYTVGLHMNFDANLSLEKMQLEKQALEKILGKTVTINRQVNNKLDFPGTYRNLIKLGIKEDHSMGYVTHLGFRAGIAFPHYFYDLEEEKTTKLQIFPYQAMDSAMRHYQKSYYRDVPFMIKNVSDEVKRFGGNFTIVFGNESVSGKRRWKKWENVYEEVIKSCI